MSWVQFLLPLLSSEAYSFELSLSTPKGAKETNQDSQSLSSLNIFARRKIGSICFKNLRNDVGKT